MKQVTPLLLFCIIFFSSCDLFYNNDNFASFKNGMLEITSAQISENNCINLSGKWEFYHGIFIDPNSSNEVLKEFEKTYIDVPGSWSTSKQTKSNFSSAGSASYRLQIKLPQDLTNIAIKLPTINTAYRFYIDGKLLAEVGRVGTSKMTSEPMYEPKLVFYSPPKTEIALVVHVSNFHHLRAGITKNIVLGKVNQIIKKRENNKAVELFMSGCIFIVLIYNLWIFIWRKKEIAMLMFSIFSFFMLIRIFFHGENIFLEIFPHFDWILHYRIELLSSFMLPPVFCFFIYYLYPYESKWKFCMSVLLIGIFSSLILFFIEAIHFSIIFNIYQYIILIDTLYVSYILIKASKNKRSGAFMLLIGTILFAYTIFNDILFAQQLINGSYILPTGFFILSLFEFSIHVHFVRAKDLLVRSENKIMALLNALPDTMAYFNQEGKILDYKIDTNNSIFIEKTSLFGKNLFTSIPEDLSEKLKKNLVHLNNNSPQLFEYKIKINKETHYFEILLIRGIDDSHLAIFRDISSLRIAEQQLIQADKLAALGTLVAGVAHEINNPNNSILLLAENFSTDFSCMIEELQHLPGIDELLINGCLFKDFLIENNESLKRIKRNSLRIKHIVAELRNFASDTREDSIESIDVHAVIEGAINLLHNKIKTSTHHFLFQKNNIPLARGHFQKLEQVIINLLQNACDSLKNPEQSISISTSFDKIQKKIRIEIIDQGIGMNTDLQEKIFDPFFTTKQSSGGLGLGLSISYKIIQSINANLQYKSAPGQGTTATILLLPA